MKKIVSLSIAVMVIGSSNLLASGIPVVDATANSQMLQQNIKQALEWAKEAQRWVDTTKHYQSQLTAYSNELATKTGVRDIMSVVKEARKLYGSGMELYSSVSSISGSLKGNMSNSNFNKLAEKLMKDSLSYDVCQGYKNNMQNICKEDQIANFKEAIFFENANQAMSESLENIDSLIKKLKNSKDIKESNDINNAINSQIALIEAHKSKIDMAMYQRTIQKDIREQKIQAESQRKFTNEWINIK